MLMKHDRGETMISLKINALLGEIVKHRAAYGIDSSTERFDANYTFQAELHATHVVVGRDLVREILVRPKDFIQADIHAAITEIDTAGALRHIPYFLASNPIHKNGEDHARSRASFIQQFNALSRELDAPWKNASASAFTELAAGAFVSPVDFARYCVDGFIECVIDRYADGHVAGEFVRAIKPSSKSIFGFFHSKNRLAAEETALSELLGRIHLREAYDHDDVMPVILSFLVQGRDPMVGSLAAFINHIGRFAPEERLAAIAEADARQVFEMAAAVNYIGRIARVDAQVGPVKIRADDRIVLILPPVGEGDAEDPQRLDLSFGVGPHRCAGKAIAYQLLDIWLANFKRLASTLPLDSFAQDLRKSGVFEEYKVAI